MRAWCLLAFRVLLLLLLSPFKALWSSADPFPICPHECTHGVYSPSPYHFFFECSGSDVPQDIRDMRGVLQDRLPYPPLHDNLDDALSAATGWWSRILKDADSDDFFRNLLFELLLKCARSDFLQRSLLPEKHRRRYRLPHCDLIPQDAPT